MFDVYVYAMQGCVVGAVVSTEPDLRISPSVPMASERVGLKPACLGEFVGRTKVSKPRKPISVQTSTPFVDRKRAAGPRVVPPQDQAKPPKFMMSLQLVDGMEIGAQPRRNARTIGSRR